MKKILLLLLLASCNKEVEVQLSIPDKITILSVTRTFYPNVVRDSIYCVFDKVTNTDYARVYCSSYSIPTSGYKTGDTLFIVTSRDRYVTSLKSDIFHFVVYYKKNPAFPFKDADSLVAPIFKL